MASVTEYLCFAAHEEGRKLTRHARARRFSQRGRNKKALYSCRTLWGSVSTISFKWKHVMYIITGIYFMREIHAINSRFLLRHFASDNRAVASWPIFQFTGSVQENKFIFTHVILMWSVVRTDSVSCLYTMHTVKLFTNLPFNIYMSKSLYKDALLNKLKQYYFLFTLKVQYVIFWRIKLQYNIHNYVFLT